MLATNKNKVISYLHDNVRGAFMTLLDIYDEVFFTKIVNV